MTGYTKLSSGILSSSIWSEDDRTRIVWITLLAMADKHGEIMASIPGVARMAGVPIPDAEKALQRFQEPDPYSRTPDKEGRRLEAIDGGWVLVNHEKYRAMFSKEDSKTKAALRQQRHRDKALPSVTERDEALRVTVGHGLDPKSNAPEGENNASVTHDRDIAEAEAEAKAEADTKKENTKTKERPPSPPVPPGPWHVLFGLDLPESLRTQNCLQAAQDWIAYKKERGQTYKPQGLKGALTSWSKQFTSATFPSAVERSIANNWAGLFPDNKPGAQMGLKIETNTMTTQERFELYRQGRL